MKKTILEIYALIICLITVTCFTVALGIGVYNTIAVVKPEFTIYSGLYSLHQTNDAFWNKGCLGVDYCATENREDERPSEAELTKLREEAYGRILASEQHNSSQTLVKCIITMLINAVTFLLHWFLAKRARASVA